MAEGMKPWEIHPSLREERLKAVAAIIRDVRAEAVESYSPEKGDIPWNLGCTVYARTCYRLTQASINPQYSNWLTVVEQDGLRFVFAVGGVPFKFYRGDDDGTAPARTLRRSFAELEAQQIAFALDDEVTSERSARLLVETGSDGLATRVVFVQVDAAGAISNAWSIPLDGTGGGTLTLPTRAEGVSLPPPEIGGLRKPGSSEAARS